MKKYEVVIIGGGPAGYTAALYCARSGYSVVVIEKLTPGGQMATTDKVDNYPGFAEGIGGFELSVNMKKGAERFGVESVSDEIVRAELKGAIKKIYGRSFEYEAQCVIIATGAYPRMLGLEGEAEMRGKGVSYCATCDGMFFRNKTVVVVGGGNSAVEDALYLSHICEKVYLVHRRDTLRASKIYADKLRESGVEFIKNSVVKKLISDGTLSGVEIESDGKKIELPCNGLFVAVGRVPDTKVFEGQIALDSSGYIIAGEDTKTNIDGVFAAGDVRTKPLRQIVTAASDGAVASKLAEEYLSSI